MNRRADHRRAGFSPHGNEIADMRAEARTPVQNPWILLRVLIITAIVFGPAVGHSFIAWDNQAQIYANPNLNPVDWHGLMFDWQRTGMTVWMPLTYLTWGAIAGVSHRPPDANGISLDPATFHAACIAFHLLATAMVFCILRRIVRSDWPAFLGAAIFSLHPLQVEPVAWASGMYTVMSGAFSLVAIDQYLRSLGSAREWKRWSHFAAASLLFIAAILSKPSAVALPVMVGVVHLLVMRARWRDLIVMFALWLPIAIIVLHHAKQFHSAENVPTLPMGQRMFVAADATGFYLSKIFWPMHLVPDYGHGRRRCCKRTACFGFSRRRWSCCCSHSSASPRSAQRGRFFWSVSHRSWGS